MDNLTVFDFLTEEERTATLNYAHRLIKLRNEAENNPNFNYMIRNLGAGVTNIIYSKTLSDAVTIIYSIYN